MTRWARGGTSGGHTLLTGAPLVRPTTLVLLFSLALSGCHTWIETDPSLVDARGEDRTLRITRSDSSVLRLDGAVVEEDSVVWWESTSMVNGARVRRSRPLPLEGVTSVEELRTDTGRTSLLVAPIAALAVAVTVFALTWDLELGR